jgi:predicted  nucleic acid-binding Zn-ribbon protein
MQDMQKEIESLKRWHGELENALLDTMVAAEAAEAALADAEANLAAVTASKGEEHRHLLDEQAVLQAQVEDYKQHRQQVLREITPENLKIYTTMKPRKNQQPVALMQGNTCSICGVAQTVAIEREVRQGIKLVNCSNCERILVAG